MHTQHNMKTLGNCYEKDRIWHLISFFNNNNNSPQLLLTNSLHDLLTRHALFPLQNGYIYFHEVATLPHFASSSLPSPTVGHVGACNKALARFLWFEPSRFRPSKPLTLRAGRLKLAIPTQNSEVQDCKP